MERLDLKESSWRLSSLTKAGLSRLQGVEIMDRRGREEAVAWDGALSEWKGSSLLDLWVEMWERCSMIVCLAEFELTREKGVE